MANESTHPNGREIRELRTKLGLSPAELAQKAKCSKRTVERAESGTPIREDYLGKIAIALQTDMKRLVAARAVVSSKDVDTRFSHDPKPTHGPHRHFLFVTLSGASAAGKDVLLDLLLDESFPTFDKIGVLRKYTTRPKRHSDHKYYRFVDERVFEELVRSQTIIFPYHKRECRYGFDRNHLFSAAGSNELLLAVFTEFRELPNARQYLAERGIRVVSILLDVPPHDLIHRSHFRFLPKDEIQSRISSIQADMRYIDAHRDTLNKTYDHVIFNGDTRAKYNTLAEVAELLRQT